MIDLAVAAVVARGLTEQQFEAGPHVRRPARHPARPAPAPQAAGRHEQPAAVRRQSWLRRLASPAS